jgi:hypothetical protein
MAFEPCGSWQTLHFLITSLIGFIPIGYLRVNNVEINVKSKRLLVNKSQWLHNALF